VSAWAKVDERVMSSVIQHRGIVERVEGDKVFVKVEKESAC
jgi:hypothetical protein